MISIQTNVDSLMAQQNLSLDNQFQSSTIQQLTSGYRINSSGDDAAGLAVANGYRSTVAELNQGVLNANNGTSQLQIIDGGLSNISTILDRLKTLATESASNTFTGSRATLNQEYSGLLSEIDRQASNVNLNSGGSFNTNLSVFIGGAAQQSNATVGINLSGAQNAVDSTSLGLSSSNVLNGGVGLTGGTPNAQRLDAPGGVFLAGGNSQAFTFNVYANGTSQQITSTITDNSAGGTGISESQVLGQLNSSLSSSGITASTDSNGLLQFSGANAFSVEAVGAAGGGTAVATAGATAKNTANYTVDGGATYVAPTSTETLKFQTSSGSATVSLAAGATLTAAIAQINSSTAGQGVYAVLNAAGTGISFQGSNSFSINDTTTATKGVFGAAAAATSNTTATAPAAGGTSNATAAITAIDAAIAQLGQVQGSVGAGENKLNYAINLAQSQISSYSSAESQIRDANVAAEAANLTKAQVLTQTSVAALAQANSEPQSILKLLQ
jgi:flagellin